ncbi:calcium ion-binding protein [Rhynchospora pubera]|uniref:Calcium ion-binding protein n=1 Tax=Rhynchospora pubera TaxID=906938 RepID=A0AAV8FB27_9POAL|nr:calcium ion-binding protein [Rhynchospora pubera]
MGLSLSLLSKLGIPGVSSMYTDQIYDRFFKEKNIKEFQEFHTAFIDLCKSFNDVMPGKHFGAPTIEKVEDFYERWKKITDEKERREQLITFVKDEVKEYKTDDNAVIMAGLIVPAAAVMVKNTAQNVLPVKQFKLHLVPNFVFVPTITMLALAGVQLVQVSKKSRS